MQDINFPEIWPDVFCVYRKVNHPSFLGTFWNVTRVLIFSLCCDVLHRSPAEKWNVLVYFKVYKCTSMHVIIFIRQYRVYLPLSTQIIYSQIAILLNILVHCIKSGAYRLYFILMTFIWHLIWNAFLRSKTATYIFISFDRYMYLYEL